MNLINDFGKEFNLYAYSDNPFSNIGQNTWWMILFKDYKLEILTTQVLEHKGRVTSAIYTASCLS